MSFHHQNQASYNRLKDTVQQLSRTEQSVALDENAGSPLGLHDGMPTGQGDTEKGDSRIPEIAVELSREGVYSVSSIHDYHRQHVKVDKI